MSKFVVQLEWTDAWVDLTDEEMGILFRKFISHAKGEEMEIKNRIVKNSWLSRVNDIDRMTKKYLKDIENGKKGGAPKGNKNASKQPKINPNTTEEKPENNPQITRKQPENNPNITYKYKENDISKDISFSNSEKDNSVIDFKSLGGYGKFLETFPTTKLKSIEEGLTIWDSLSQHEKKEVMRHTKVYIREMKLKGQEKFIKNTYNYLQARLWEQMKPESIDNKLNRGLTNMTFVNYISKIADTSVEETRKFLYLTSTDNEFREMKKLYDDHNQQLFKQN